MDSTRLVARRAVGADGRPHGKLVIEERPEMMIPMDVTPEEAERLLDEVREATRTAKHSREVADRDSTLRRAKIEAAMLAGIPREDIASAAGVHRNVLYQILKAESRSK